MTDANDLANAVRRAFTHAKNGRQRPVVLEIPGDLWGAEIEEPINYTPTPAYRSGPDPADARKAAQTLVNAERPVIYAGQGVHYAKAWDQLRELAELLESPVTTSLQGKSAFPETHPLSLGSGGRAFPKAVHEFLRDADVVFGIGCSFAKTGFGLQMPKGPYYIHSTLDPEDFNNEVEISEGVVGDADAGAGRDHRRSARTDLWSARSRRRDRGQDRRGQRRLAQGTGRTRPTRTTRQ